MIERSRVVSCDKDVLGGIPVFVGTRVPAKTLLHYLQTGHDLDAFLDDFPTVKREQAQELLASFESQLAACA